MAIETKNCEKCRQNFIIDEDIVSFYKKFGVSMPKMCPLCRAQRRLVFRNERVFYKRPCDKCKKEVVSMYSPNKPYPVWCHECWFSDDWNATTYGQDYNPNLPFLEQVKDLYNRVPKVALIYVRSVNSEYVNISADNKNCYMLVESSNNESCIHSYWIQQCRDSVDLSFSHQTELAYESDDCYNSYRLLYSKGCYNCRDSYFLYDCRGCSDCIGCTNLRNKQFHVFNKPMSKSNYENFLKSVCLDTTGGVEEMRRKFSDFIKTQPRKYAEIINSPGSSGSYIKDAKNCRECFHCYEAEDCAYGEHVWRQAKDCLDVSTAGRNASMIYNSINCGIDVGNMVCVVQGWSSTFLEYSLNCLNSNYCLGSAGLRKKDYCILNKQYSREEYEVLRRRVIDEIKTKGEYGEFFPASFAPFGYNETVAHEQFPLSKDEAKSLGFKWEDHPRGTYKKETIKWESIPESIKDFEVTDINKEIFACLNCDKNYRIIPAELKFYRHLDIPLPRFCPDCRHDRRMSARGPNRLFGPQKCQCDYEVYKNSTKHAHHPERRCPNEFYSNYDSDAAEILYCEHCYNLESS